MLLKFNKKRGSDLKSVLFLDIDGVLNSKKWEKDHIRQLQEKKQIDPEAVKKLAKIVKSTGAIIILHSGWRFWFDQSMNPIREESQYLVNLFHKQKLKMKGVTPDLTTKEIRRTKKFSLVKADEILLWLKNHPNYQKWLVLDDLELHNNEVEKHQIRTDSRIGISEEDVEKAINLLNANE